MKASKVVKLALLGSSIALSGCSSYEDRRIRDGVPVAAMPTAGYHWSPYYNGYVPLIVPTYGYSGGVTYYSVYHSSPSYHSYPAPRPRASISAPATTAAKPSTSAVSTARPSTPTAARPATTSRGGFGGFGSGSIGG
jgi:uncharacterized protein YgiB involved in biofilm formation